MTTKRVADFIFEYLNEKHGVKDVFTVSGGGAIFLCDALYQNPNINYYACHHEQAVTMATESYARVKNDFAVSLVTTGPGGTNAITGVAGSWMDSVPHLTLSGQVFYKQTIGKTGLRQLGIQEINIIDLVKPVTKYAVLIDDPLKVKYELDKAIFIAKTGRPGPVWLDIPGDVQNAKVDPEAFLEFNPKTLSPESPKDPEFEAKVKKVARLLRKAKRPILHVGQGVKLSGGEDAFISLVEKASLPFVTARNANDLIETSHPLFVGRPGTFAQRGANFAIQNCDFYVAIGTRLSMPQTGYNTKDFARNAYKVMVDVDEKEIRKETLAIDIPIRADAREFILALKKELEDLSFQNSAWLKQCQTWKEKYPVILPEHKAVKDYINSYHFIDVLCEHLNSQDVIVTDMGLSFQGTHQAFRVKRGQKFFTNCGLASMGWGLPAAVGACVAHDKKRTICIAGDGGLQMTIQELATVFHYQLPVKLFVQNNGGYLTIKQTQEIGFGGRIMGCNPDSGLSFPDFSKVAEAYGIRSIRLKNHTELEANIQAILDDPAPVLIELMMDPNQEQSPKVISKKKPDGTSQQTPIEDMYPFLDKDELESNTLPPSGVDFEKE